MDPRKLVFIALALSTVIAVLALGPSLAVCSTRDVTGPLGTGEAQVVTFTQLDPGITGFDFSSAAWGDYDNDGDLDLLLSGQAAPPVIDAATFVFRNDGGAFVNLNAGLTGLRYGTAAWGDFDGDGDLDIVSNGQTVAGSTLSRQYRNNGNGTFASVTTSLPAVYNSSLAVGDYDNDGDLDVLVTGRLGASPITRIYRNDGSGAFSYVTDLAGVGGSSAEPDNRGSCAWGDYDSDGDLDILLTGWTGTAAISRVYRNDGGGTFTDIAAGLVGVYYSSCAWGDYDNDGDLDILLCGSTAPSGKTTQLYRNDGGGVFTNISTALPANNFGSLSWGDYDNDGDLDVLINGSTTGSTGLNLIARVYRNDGGGTFADLAAGLTGTYLGTTCWGDYDNDGDLDILLTGFSGGPVISRIFRSDGATANTVPSAPSGLAVTATGAQATFGWLASTDTQTPAAGLSYNLRIGTSPGGQQTCPAMSNAGTGYRRIVQLGNAQQRRSWTLQLPAGTYYWSVQAVDGARAGSPFAAERMATTLYADAAVGLPGVNAGSLAWGDYDNDGDLDVLLTGFNGSAAISRIYRNDAGSFVDAAVGFPGVANVSAATWADLDGDGDLDVVLAGDTGTGYIARVYRNQGGGTFTDLAAGLTGAYQAALACGDYDNDGDLDIVLSGATGADPNYAPITRLYRNDGGGTFTLVSTALPAVRYGSLAWADADADGDLDLLLTGYTGTEYLARVYRNDGAAVFTNLGAALPGVRASSVAWGDYDNDGDADILLSGWNSVTYFTDVYRNNGSGVFTAAGLGMTAVYSGSVAWGDCDNDGDLDALITGYAATGVGVARLYRNDGPATFTDLGVLMTGVYTCATAWGDYDNDGDLDVLLSGFTGTTRVAQLYRRDGGPANTPPSAPSGLSATVAGRRVTFNWNASADGQTPSAGLSYNLRLGTTAGGNELSPSMAAPGGYRRIVRSGNTQQRRSWSLDLPPGVNSCWWTVQSVDAAFAGSAFAGEQNIVLATGVDESAPPTWSLEPHGPNPVNRAARFRLGLPGTSWLRASVYDIVGREVARPIDSQRSPGWQSIEWDASRQHAGVYLLRVASRFGSIDRKVVVLH